MCNQHKKSCAIHFTHLQLRSIYYQVCQGRRMCANINPETNRFSPLKIGRITSQKERKGKERKGKDRLPLPPTFRGSVSFRDLVSTNFVIWCFLNVRKSYGCQPKNMGILPPKMDGLFHGSKPY